MVSFRWNFSTAKLGVWVEYEKRLHGQALYLTLFIIICLSVVRIFSVRGKERY
jgi:hypothetical protein